MKITKVIKPITKTPGSLPQSHPSQVGMRECLLTDTNMHIHTHVGIDGFPGTLGKEVECAL